MVCETLSRFVADIPPRYEAYRCRNCLFDRLLRPVSDRNFYHAITWIDNFPSGNWGVDLQAGSQFGYTLLFTVLLAGIIATFLQVGAFVPPQSVIVDISSPQVLAARLGVVTGLGKFCYYWRDQS
jgi:hypothetical protein